jgi:thiosulfate dehydrogenase [quinone] large subunit
MYAAATPGVPATTNPAVDDHIVDACLLIGLALVGAGRVMGLGLWWSRLPFVQRHPFLK